MQRPETRLPGEAGGQDRPLGASCHAQPHRPPPPVDHPRAPGDVRAIQGSVHASQVNARTRRIPPPHTNPQQSRPAIESRATAHTELPIASRAAASRRRAVLLIRRRRKKKKRRGRMTWPLSAAAPPGCRSTNLRIEYLFGFSSAPIPATSPDAIAVAGPIWKAPQSAIFLFSLFALWQLCSFRRHSGRRAQKVRAPPCA